MVLPPPHSLPQTSSGKLSRSRAHALYLAAPSSQARPIPLSVVRGSPADAPRGGRGRDGFCRPALGPAFRAAGWSVRALVRRARRGASPEDAETVIGATCSDAGSLTPSPRAPTAIHAAGLIKARNLAAFFAVNRDGAGAWRRRWRAKRWDKADDLISSLAARAPRYRTTRPANKPQNPRREPCGRAAGVVRPPVIYGPGDRETLPCSAWPPSPLARRSRLGAARLALAHADDVAAASSPGRTARDAGCEFGRWAGPTGGIGWERSPARRGRRRPAA